MKTTAEETVTISKEEQKKLLKEANVSFYLNLEERYNLFWWAIFKKNRIETFFMGLKIGKAAKFAYKDAKECK